MLGLREEARGGGATMQAMWGASAKEEATALGTEEEGDEGEGGRGLLEVGSD